MANRVHVWYAITNKILAILSLVLAIFVIADCSYVIVNVNREKVVRVSGNATIGSYDPNVKMSKNYSTVVKVTSAIAICAAALQFFFSLKMSLSCSDKAGMSMKVWIFAHVLAFTAILVCILLPAFYPKKSRASQDFEVHNIEFKRLGKLVKDPSKIFDDKTQYMTYYFLGLIINNTFLLIFLILTCCCMRCGQFDDYSELK